MTGIAPPEALIRSPETELIRPRERNETVPTKVSSAIMQGLAIRPDDRIRTIPELSSRLLPSKAPTGGDAPTVAIPAIPSGNTEKAVLLMRRGIRIILSAIRLHRVAMPPDAAAGEPPRTQRTTGSRPAVSRDSVRLPSSVISSSAVRNNAMRLPAPVQRNQRPVQANHVSAKEMEKKKERNVVLTAMFVTLPILLIILIFTFWILFGERAATRIPIKTISFLPTVLEQMILLPARFWQLYPSCQLLFLLF